MRINKFEKWVDMQYQIAEQYNKNQPDNKKIRVFFRGEPEDYSTKLCPSVYRNEIKDSKVKLIYEEAIARYNQEFKDDKTACDKLVRMQHYNIPTRLLDVSIDPIVALYFACLKTNKKKSGKVYSIFISNEGVFYPSNPLAAILPRFRTFFVTKSLYFDIILSPDDKKKIETHHDIKTYMDILDYHTSINYNDALTEAANEAYFEKSDYNIINLTGIFAIIPNYNNQRIVNQRSAFILGGFSDEDAKLNNIFEYKNIKFLIDNCNPFNVEAILTDLANCDSIEKECKKLLIDFFKNRRDKKEEYFYSDFLWKEILKELVCHKSKNSNYLEYLLFTLGLARRKGKIAFYNCFDINNNQKSKIIDNYLKPREITESYLFPNLEHYGNEIKKRYSL